MKEINIDYKKGVAHIALIVLILAAAGAGIVYFAMQNPSSQEADDSQNLVDEVEFPTQQITAEVSEIESREDLDTTLEDLENTDIDQIDQLLQENEEDSSEF